MSARSDSHNRHSYSRYTEALSESKDSRGGHWKSRSKKKKSNREEDDLSQPWVCEEIDHFTPRIRYFDFLKTRMPSHIKTYDGSENPKDHIKIFRAAAKTERWAMLTWCHMFNSTLTKNARNKCIKDPIELHNIKLHDRKSTDDFVRRGSGSLESRSEEFVSTMEKPEGNQKQNFKKGGFQNQQRPERKQDRFTLLTKTPKEIFALEKGKFKASPPMRTPIHRQNHTKFCEFHGKVGHNTDECMHLMKQIEKVAQDRKAIALNKRAQTKQCKRTTQGEILFPPLNEEERTEGPMIIEAEIGGHCIHRMYVDGESASEIFSVNSSGNAETPGRRRSNYSKKQQVGSLECVLVFEPGETLSATKPNLEERVKVATKPEYLEQAVMIGSALIEGGRNKLCGLLQHEYKGYHQIQMAKKDKEKTAFITNQRISCYTKMPFGLRNTEATYQHLVDKVFYKQIGRNLEVYVDDLVIKSCTKDEIVRDIEETFKTLRKINMKLNPKKCTFGVEEGMFLGYKVSTKGLKVCPDKVDVVLSLSFPKCLKDVQNLNGKLASLNRSGRGIQANETANSEASHAHRTNGKGGAYRLFGGS
nr:reverse transcriptase domain-containing protein [Tanacetum cinerariifolium]